jgi:hypothetical protein
MKKLFLLLFAIVCYSVVLGQTPITVTFKPGPIIGKDAEIHEMRGCIPNGATQPVEDTNYGNIDRLRIMAWTWNSQGCGEGTFRALLKFDELSTIPANAEILSAELKLFGLPLVADVGNSSYPGSPYNNSSYPPGHMYNTTNESLIQRVTSPWNEQTVTWNTQPTTTTANQITIPNTTSQWNWNYTNSSANLVAMIQDMVNNPSTNFGFMFKLQNETRYRSVYFVSSDHSNPALWPELTVTYTGCSTDTIYIQKPCPCEANFSYIVNTLDLSSYYFMASNPADRYTWMINRRIVSDASAFSYTFRAEGNYEVCYYRASSDQNSIKECKKCINLCIGKDILSPVEDEIGNVDLKESEIKDGVIQGTILPGDQISADSSTENAKIEVFPNPTTNGWTVRITTEKEEAIKIQLSDMVGKIIYSDNKMLSSGMNSFEINTNNLISGNYGLQIVGKSIQSSQILMKK